MNENKKKIAFIINPISGTQSKEQILKWLDEKLDKERYAQEVIYTERAGHAVEIAAQKAQEDAHAVIAIGGDGTINEIARSLVHTKTALGIIPCGSGNGLARHLQIPMEPKKAIDIINDGLIDIIDYGKINDVPFFCTCGVGFDAFVSLQFSKAGRRGPLTYLEKTLLESLKYRPETYELEMDGSTLSAIQGVPDSLRKRIAIWKQCVYCPTSHLERRTAGRHHTRAVHCARCTIALFPALQQDH